MQQPTEKPLKIYIYTEKKKKEKKKKKYIYIYTDGMYQVAVGCVQLIIQ